MYISTAKQKKERDKYLYGFSFRISKSHRLQMDKEENMWMFAAETPLQYNTSQLENVWSRVYKEVISSLNCTIFIYLLWALTKHLRKRLEGS